MSTTGYRSLKPLWLAANHERAFKQKGHVAATATKNQLEKLRAFTGARKTAKQKKDIEATDAFGFTTMSPTLFYDLACWNRLLAQKRFQSTPYPSFGGFREAFEAMGHQPMGLDTLPPAWWHALVRLTAAFSQKHSFTLLGLTQEDGCIEALLTGKGSPPAIYEGWVASLERALYPIRTRPLKKRDLRFLETPGVLDEAPDDEMNEPTE